MATTIIERESSSSTFLALVLLAVLVIAGFWYVHSSGMIGNTTVIEHSKTVVMPNPRDHDEPRR